MSCLSITLLSVQVADFNCPLCQCVGTVVKMDDPKEIKKQQNEYERDFLKKVKEYEKTTKGNGNGKGKGDAKKPRKTGYPEMHYACACPHMRTYRGDIASSTCKDCKARGYVFFSCRRRQPWPRGVVQGASACWLVQILGAGALLIRDKKLPSSPHQRNIGLQKKSTPVSWAAPSLKSADKCSKGRPQLSKQR